MTDPEQLRKLVADLRKQADRSAAYSSALLDARQHVAWRAADVITRLLDEHEALKARVAVTETWESINQWCDDTFGSATTARIIERAKEEFDELEKPDADHAIEAADVTICLCRIPGFAEALQRKMAINRARKWQLTGEGTGYHIPEPTLSKDQADG